VNWRICRLKHIEHACEIADEQIVLVEAVRVEGGATYVRLVNNILHGDLVIALFQHERHQRGAEASAAFAVTGDPL